MYFIHALVRKGMVYHVLGCLSLSGINQTSCRWAAATICPRSSPPPVGAKRLSRLSRRQCSSSFSRPTRSHAHRCSLQLPDALTRRWVKRPGDVDLWPFVLESGVRVTCDVGYLCNFLNGHNKKLIRLWWWSGSVYVRIVIKVQD